MTKKIWNSDGKVEEVTTPYEFLFHYASMVKDDTDGKIVGLVTENISDSANEVVYALYLVVPELRNYSYRLIEVVQPSAFSPYPVTMKLFGKAAGNIVVKEQVPFEGFEAVLLEFIQNPMTKLIIQGLYTHIDIKRKYE
ncbi:MAG: hypothetical protein WCO44_16870 [Bacteroidota bacterium]